MIPFPNINPVLIEIGPLAIRWYGLAYIAGILLGVKLVTKDLLRLGLSKDQVYTFMTWIILGIFFGGRLGYVLFYDLGYYTQSPAAILAVWQGGMSYHGAALGCVFGLYIYSRRIKVPFLALLDLLGFASTIGVFFGRIANFINAELYGRITTVPWGIIFPTGGDSPRHPSQLYEAFGEGVFLFILLAFIRKKHPNAAPGLLFSYYLLLYGSIRFCIEFFREPDRQLGYIGGLFTLGQWLCMTMVITGLGLYIGVRQKNIRKKKSTP